MNHVSHPPSLPRRVRTLAVAAMLFSCAGLAQAQWMWVDAKGVKQFSDQPPPPSVPLKQILKAPKGQPTADSIPAAADSAASAGAASGGDAAPKAAPKGLATLAEREADYVKRQKEKAEKDKKESDEKARRLALAESCEQLRASRRSIDSGARIATTDANGERSFMSDEQRAAETRRVDKVLAGCPAR